MAILHTLYDTVPGSPISKLSQMYIAGTSTDIILVDGTIAPDAPNIITVMTEDKSEFATVMYDAKVGNILTDLTVIRGDGISFDAGTSIAVRNYTYEDDSGIKGDIIDHESRIETLEGTSINAVAGVKVGGAELQKDAENKVNIPVGSASVLGVVKSGTEAVISSDGSIDISTATDRLETAINAVSDDLSDHVADKENPHEVTKAQVGLGSVDNTSDIDKPISTAVQAALDAKGDDDVLQEHISDTGNPHEVTKTQVGLGNADNTSDLNKPISTATGAALAQKADSTSLQTHVADKTNPHEVTAAQVGLGNVDNTSDADKPISTAAQTALNGKVDKVTGKGLSTNDFTDAYKGKIEENESGLADHIADTDNPHDVTATQIGVEEGAEVNVLEGIKVAGVDAAIIDKKSNIPPATTTAPGVVIVGSNLTVDATGRISAVVEGAAQSDWSETNPLSPAFIKEKPQLGTASALDVAASGNAGTGQVVKGNDTRLTDSRTPSAHASSHYGSGADAIPNATQTTNGLMSSADKVKLNGIEEQAQKNVQSDWNAVSGDKFIANKPQALSEFSNDENFQTDTQVASSIGTHNSSNSAHADIRGLVSSEVSRAEGEEQSLQDQIDALASRTDVADVVATYADLDLSKYLVNDIVKVMQDETRGGAITYYKVVESGGVKSWSYVGSQGPFYTKTEADGYFVPQQRTINGQALTGNVTLDAEDVGALPDDTTLADIPDDSTHRVVTDTQINTWNAKQGALTFDSAPTQNSTNPVYSGGVYSALQTKVDSEDFVEHVTDDQNPHGVTASQVGLGNVNNTADMDKPVSTATATALAGKVDKEDGKGLSDANYTAAEKTKLSGIEAGAQVNVQASWSATSGPSAIIDKPPLGTAAAKNVPATGDATAQQVVMGNDSRLNDARTPSAHASSHAAGGSDALTPAAIGAEPAITKRTAFNKDFGTDDDTVCAGNDARLSDTRNPKAHAASHASGGSDPITPASIGAEASFSKNTAFNKNFGTSEGTVCEGNDSRLMTTAERTKLSGIEDGAQVNVQANWNATTPETGAIAGKPTLGTAAALDVASTGDASTSQVVKGNDSRLSDARTPVSHATTATTYGVSSASNYGHPKATSTTPAALASSASVGTDDGTYARGNHAHRNPIKYGTGNPPTSGNVAGDVYFKYV